MGNDKGWTCSTQLGRKFKILFEKFVQLPQGRPSRRVMFKLILKEHGAELWTEDMRFSKDVSCVGVILRTG